MKLPKFRVFVATSIAALLLAPTSVAFAADGNPASVPAVSNIPADQSGLGFDDADVMPAFSASVGFMGRAALPDDNELVTMPDPVLYSIVAQRVGESTLTRGGLRKLVTLKFPNSGITDLTGLEYASNLDLVDLSRNAIPSIEPLRGLDNIRQLNVSSTQITDIAAVATMPKIDYLQFNWTTVSDLEPVRGKNQLWRIEMAGTKVASLDAVEGLPNLIELYFQETSVSDLTPLAGLTKLITLSAPNTEISNLHTVAGLPKLQIVNVNNARVSDLSMVDTWPSLRQVGFLNQRVTGFPVVASQTESTYRTTEATTAPFTMLDGVVLTASGSATTTPEGLTIWSDIPEDATGLTSQISGDPLPGSGATYSATLTYPLTRADFTNADPAEVALGGSTAFQFTVDAGFVSGPFSLTSGEVPGLKLDASGALAGTPTEEGTFPLSVRRTDVYGNMIDHDYTVVVGEAIIVDPPVVPTDPPVDPTDPPVDPIAPPAGPSSPGTVTSSGSLALTGSDVSIGAVMSGVLAMLLAGAVSVVLARSRRESLDD